MKFIDYEPIVAEDDDWGQWNRDTVEWLFKPFNAGKIKVRDEEDEI